MKELFLRLRCDDEAVIKELRKKLFTRGRAMAAKAGMPRLEDFEEVFHDVLVEVWKKRHTLDNDTNLEAFIFISLRNKCIDHLRRKKSSGLLNTMELGEEDAVVWTDSKFDLGQTYDIMEALYKAFQALPAQCRQVMHLHFRVGLTVSAIVAVTGIAQPNVSGQLKIGLARLFAAMQLVDPQVDQDTILYYLPQLDFPEE